MLVATIATPSDTLASVVGALNGGAIAAQDEAELSRFVLKRLTEAGLDPKPEVRVSVGDRIDFVVGRIGIEIKHRAGFPSVIRQLDRYAQSDQLDELILVTSSWKLANKMPAELRGKRLTVLMIGASL